MTEDRKKEGERVRRWEGEKILKRNILISVSCPPCFGWIRLRILDLKKEYIPLPTQLLIFSSISFSTSSPPSILAFKPPNLRASSIEHPVSSIEHPASSIQYPVSRVHYRASSIQYPASSIQYPNRTPIASHRGNHPSRFDIRYSIFCSSLSFNLARSSRAHFCGVYRLRGFFPKSICRQRLNAAVPPLCLHATSGSDPRCIRSTFFAPEHRPSAV